MYIVTAALKTLFESKMKTNSYSMLATCCVALAIFTIGCTSGTSQTSDSTEQAVAKPDMAVVKADIQALETAWAAADNARDAKAIVAFYADDAVSMANNSPRLVGKVAILKDVENALAKRGKGTTLAFETLEVFGDGNMVTEVGKATGKDASGKTTYTGKYMAIWEKRNGKYLTIRDINNDDVKAK